jgi:tetratricopeptide (TPR) repeat protein
VAEHAVDLADRHFRPKADHEPSGPEALLVANKGLRNLASLAGRSGPERTRPLILLGASYARKLLRIDPDDAEAWKLIGQFEVLRESTAIEPVPRFRMPFDPVFDLSSVRTTYALKHALESKPDDFLALMMLEQSFESRAMTEAALPLVDRLVALTPLNGRQAESQKRAEASRSSLRAALGPMPPASWENLSQLGQIVNGLLGGGRAETAADYLERAWPAESRSWEEADRIATLRLHLGQSARARDIWVRATPPTNPAVRDARVAITHLVEGDFETSRRLLHSAISADPTLFEAHFVLAVLEQDAGRAVESLAAARKARSLALGDVSRDAVSQILKQVTPYATPPLAVPRRSESDPSSTQQ